MGFKILFSNIGYARGIDGTLKQHIIRAWRNIYTGEPLQREVLTQLKGIIAREKPDVCCFIEIDDGSFHAAYFNQLQFLLDDEYLYYDLADKYGPGSIVGRLPLHIGKSSAFMSKTELPFGRLYFSAGSKRLVHRITLPGGVPLYFTHFSLRSKVRARQFAEMKALALKDGGPVVILADFNILKGFSELSPLLEGTDLAVMGGEGDHTFRIHRKTMALDLCICSKALAEKLSVKIIPQPFSDHAALLVEGQW